MYKKISYVWTKQAKNSNNSFFRLNFILTAYFQKCKHHNGTHYTSPSSANETANASLIIFDTDKKQCATEIEIET